MIDKEGIFEHLRELEEGLRDCKRYQETVSLADLKTDRDKRNMVLHAILVTVQASIDIANHLIQERNLRRPETYRESFEILGEAGFISPSLAEGLADLAGFRNILVHIYWRLDLEKVFGVLQHDLDFLREFIETVKRLIRE